MSHIKTAVSMYSLQDEYARKRMTLQQILDELDAMGVEGLEIISDQMVRNSPHPSDEELFKWDELLKSHNVKPVCNDTFINTTLYANRTLRTKECVDLLKADIDVTARLGFPLIRLVSMTPASVVEQALPYAEEKGVKLALEVHAGMSFDNPMTKAFCDMMFRLNSPFLGLVVDTGIFCTRHPKVSTDYFLSLGLNPEIAKYVDDIFASGTDAKQFFKKHGVPAELEAMMKTQTDREYVIFSDGYERTPYEVLDKYMPYVFHIHGKCFGFGEDGEEQSIPFGEIIGYLHEKNYDGYIATEYEGNRFVPVGGVADGLSNVKKHQALLKKYIDACEKGA